MFKLNFDKIKFDQVLGSGKFGTVYPYQKNPEDMKWAVKHLFAKNDQSLFQHFNEVVLGFSCNHESIVPVKGYFIDKQEKPPAYNIYLKMPRMKETLSQIIQRNIQNNTPFQEEDILKIFYSLVCGLEYLHNEKKIAHRDIKPDNILFDYEGNAKLSDIGVAEFVGDHETSYLETKLAGTPYYVAPETQKINSNFKKKDWYKADAWSLGVVIVDLCLLKPKIISSFEIQDLVKLEGKYSSKLIYVLKALLKAEPAERLGIEEIKKELETVMDPNIKNKNSLKSINNLVINNLEENKNEKEEVQNMVQNNVVKKEDINRKLIIGGVNSDQGTKYLADRISVNLKNLQTLHLQFPNSNKISDEGVKYLADRISSNLKNLQTLHLQFLNSYNISDEGVKYLADRISSNLKNLQTLHLQFAGRNAPESSIYTLISNVFSAF